MKDRNNDPSGVSIVFSENGDVNHHLGTGSFVSKGIISTVKRVGFVSDRMS
jgi:hypothetical protein